MQRLGPLANRFNVRILSGLLCAGALVGCFNTQHQMHSINETEALRGDELHRTLAGARLMSTEAGAYEQFCESGRWHSGNVRAPRVGRYEVRDDQFCVWRDGEDIAECRRLYKHANDTYSLENAASVLLPTSVLRTDASPC